MASFVWLDNLPKKEKFPLFLTLEKRQEPLLHCPEGRKE